MRVFLFALALGAAGAALMPSQQALAWHDHWGRWHPNYERGYYAQRVYGPPPWGGYRHPYGRWIPPHYNYYGRFIPGHRA
jgi:hypothetical protein